MSEKQIARWEKQKAKGKWFFVVKNTAILSCIWFFSSLVVEYFFEGEITQIRVICSLVVSLIFASLLNIWLWTKAEASSQGFLLNKVLINNYGKKEK